MVLLNLLIAIMGDTWQRVKDSADEEWKFLLVQDMEEFFDLHPVPPPFNALVLLSRIHQHMLSDGSVPLSVYGGRRGPLLSAGDIKKKSKVAQLDLLRKRAAEEAKTMEAQMERLSGNVSLSTERLEQLAQASDATRRAVAMLQLSQQQMQQQMQGAPPAQSLPASAERGVFGRRGSMARLGSTKCLSMKR